MYLKKKKIFFKRCLVVVSTPASQMRQDTTHPLLPHAAGMQHRVSVPQNADFSQLRRVALTDLRCCWLFVTDCVFDFICCSGIFSEAVLAEDFLCLPTPSRRSDIFSRLARRSAFRFITVSLTLIKTPDPLSLSLFLFLLCLKTATLGDVIKGSWARCIILFLGLSCQEKFQ